MAASEIAPELQMGEAEAQLSLVPHQVPHHGILPDVSRFLLLQPVAWLRCTVGPRRTGSASCTATGTVWRWQCRSGWCGWRGKLAEPRVAPAGQR